MPLLYIERAPYEKQMHAILTLSLTGLSLSSAYKAMEQTAGYMKIEWDAAEASSIAMAGRACHADKGISRAL